ncbi:MAG: efflux RND transporter permease subunit, partial [Rhodocyclales bacterium]|nr:efflux RND transporter permease subunit [Rhodocyclales bacterium]
KLLKFGTDHHGDIYDTPFYRGFRALLVWCLRRRWLVIGATTAAFALSIVAFNVGIQKQFFPSASRPELLIEIWLPQGASLKATATEALKVEALLAKDAGVASSSTYIGNGAPRFFLSLDQQLFADNFAQAVIVTKGLVEREEVKRRLEERFAAADFAHLRARVQRLENGPPVGFPVQFRVMGEDLEALRRIAGEVATIMRADPNLQNVQFDWNEKIKSVKVDIDQDRARLLGVSSQDVALTLQAWLVGAAVTQYREGDQLIDVVWRASGADRTSLDRLPDLDIVAAGGRHVPLAQVARLKPVLEEGLIWRRDRLPTLTVRADLAGAKQAPMISAAINPQLDPLRAKLPPGFRIETGGAVEESAKGEDSIKAVMPVMVAVVVTLLMLQLQSMGRTVMVLLTAPLGLIGVAVALLVFRAPFGFVANLGVIALMGMILRNSVILVDQIDQDERAGKSTWEAIIGSTVRRFRPIVLTAAAAIMAMIPLTRQVFWGPMAIAIMGGLVFATALTCLFLPALYAAWYKVKEE